MIFLTMVAMFDLLPPNYIQSVYPYDPVCVCVHVRARMCACVCVIGFKRN